MTTIRTMPNVLGSGRVDLKGDQFDVLIAEKGLDVTWESAIRCPCKLDGRANMPTCINCSGCGYVFINPVKTKMVIQSMNISTKTTGWSVERVGIANITTRSIDNVGDMDKITVDKATAKMSQVVRPKMYKNKLFAFTNYPIIDIIDVFLFKSDSKKLELIPSSKYSIEANKIILNKSLFVNDMSITVRYKHPLQYFVVDIPRETRESVGIDLNKEKTIKLPVSAIGRRCHHVLRPQDFDPAEIVDNSYE